MRGTRIARATMLAAALVSALAVGALAAPTPAFAATGSGGWFWPTGTEDFGGFQGFWAPRGGSWHLAQDMKSTRGKPVYAIGDGTVLESKFVSGYGPGGGQGGAVVILHRTASGIEFKALYGHLENLKFKKGQAVKAGAVIGTVNGSSPNHVHFGINPGRAYPHDNNPFRGHTYSQSDRYGFVDPVAFLRQNLRVVYYHPPAVPEVAALTTTRTPVWAWAARDCAWWAVRSTDATPVTERWNCRIGTTVKRRLCDTATVPPADNWRYTVQVTTAPSPMVRVFDRVPRLTLGVSTTKPKVGTNVRVGGRLQNAAGKPFSGGWVYLERYEAGAWKQCAKTFTSPQGVWCVTWRPPGSRTLRARFGCTKAYQAAASAPLSVYPQR